MLLVLVSMNLLQLLTLLIILIFMYLIISLHLNHLLQYNVLTFQVQLFKVLHNLIFHLIIRKLIRSFI